MDDKIREMVNRISWFGHSAFRIAGSKTIYFDPWNLPAGVGGDGDVVFVSHDHYDHCSPTDIKKALAKSGKVVAAECCRAKYPKADLFVLPYTKHNLDGLSIYTTTAYNVKKPYHTRDMGHCGYIVDLDGVKIYHAGDTDAIPHMRDFKCDIALLPVSGTYTMDPLDAVEAVNMLKPAVAIPMHWGGAANIGKREDAERFKKLAPCEVIILEAGG
ncbi:MAG: MBL fold metallo-hydrolase [Calditrichaeota bacterium]|nr:MBL fold metallo-hydrolase [Calditrichota bacterium]